LCVAENTSASYNPAAREKDRFTTQLDDYIIHMMSTGITAFLLVAGSRHFEEVLRWSFFIMNDKLNTHDDVIAINPRLSMKGTRETQNLWDGGGISYVLQLRTLNQAMKCTGRGMRWKIELN
jgi:hypothetical protein